MSRPHVALEHLAFWQYSESGSVAGMSGAVDLHRFNGSLDELRALASDTHHRRWRHHVLVSDTYPL